MKRTAPLLVLLCTAAIPLRAQDTTSLRSSSVGALEELDTALTFLRHRNAREYAVTSPNGIDVAEYVRIGGIDQWITVQGEDRRNPVILFLHGGPGDVTSPWGHAFFRGWLKRFTVVQWDQRGAGRTLGRNGPSLGPTITPARMVQDGIELADTLRAMLHHRRIILIGHSWGSVLGVLMVKARPDLFSAYVGTGQVAADPATTAAAAYQSLLAEAWRRGDHEALQELQQVGPPPWATGPGYGVLHKWAFRFERADLFLGAALGVALVAPGHSAQDINDWFNGQILSGERLGPEFARLDSLMGGTFALPVVVIQGAEDFTTPTTLARRFVDRIHAPHKAFVALVGGGHFAVFTKSDAFLNELIQRVLPLTRGS